MIEIISLCRKNSNTKLNLTHLKMKLQTIHLQIIYSCPFKCVQTND